MAYCKKCGAYIPIDETVCPACGYDPEEEARRAEEAARQAEEEARRERERAEAEAEARRRKEEAEEWARLERERAEQRRQNYRSGNYNGTTGEYRSQSASQGASRTSSQTWTPPWSTQQSGSYTQSNGNSTYQGSYTQTNRSSGGYQGSYTQTGSTYSDDSMRERVRQSADSRWLSALSYFWPFALVPLFLRRDDDFARYHTNQGLVLLIATAIAGALAGAASSGFLGTAVTLFNVYCKIKGVTNVLNGKREPLPLIGEIKII